MILTMISKVLELWKISLKSTSLQLMSYQRSQPGLRQMTFYFTQYTYTIFRVLYRKSNSIMPSVFKISSAEPSSNFFQ